MCALALLFALYLFQTSDKLLAYTNDFFLFQLMFGGAACCVCDTHSTPAVTASSELCQAD